MLLSDPFRILDGNWYLLQLYGIPSNSLIISKTFIISGLKKKERKKEKKKKSIHEEKKKM